MIRKVKCFFSLPPEEKKLFLEAYIMLAFMRAATLTISFKRLTRSLYHSKDTPKPDALTDEQLDTAKRIGKVIKQAMGNTPQ